MKRLIPGALAALLWLAGCADLLPATSKSSTAPIPVTGTRPAPSAAAEASATPTGQPGVMPVVPVSELRSVRVATLQAPADLWERIRRGFAMPDLDDELVRKHEAWYLKRPDYIERMVERSRLYLFHIVEELELRGMPTELALLPYIESAFNPQAISSAKAAGMWQFMPATGRHFQLTQNTLRDDRRSVLESTRAALDYLQKLHAMFGDWHLALAAYNWGEGNVSRAIERNKAAGRATGYGDLSMPAETRNYVPKLQAIKNIIARPDALGAELPLIGNHPFFDTVDITRDIDVEVAARLAEVRIEDFRALNPSQRKPVIFAAGTPQILLPWDNATTFKGNLAAADPATLASWTAWVAPRTMSVREAAQAVDMPEARLRQLNEVPRGMKIRKGSTLLVPRNGNGPAAVSSQVVNHAQIAYTPEVVLRRTVVRARKGDTIATLAERYDLPAATVARWNKARAGTTLAAGRAVVVYLPARAGTPTASGAPRANGKATAPRKTVKRRSKSASRRAAPAKAARKQTRSRR